MKAKKLPSKEIIESLLNYDRNTGQFFWKPRSASQVKGDGEAKRWNGRYANKEAGSVYQDHSCDLKYRKIAIRKKFYAASRLAMIVLGYTQEELADKEVDHIDGNPLNNRPDNLRLVVTRQNSMNRKIRKDNTSGYTGVVFYKPAGMWKAQVSIGGAQVSRGYYKNKEDAAEAVRLARAEESYTERHGL